MQKTRAPGKGANSPITIRLPPDTETYFRKRAQREGLSFNGYLTKYLIEGHIASTVEAFETTMRTMIGNIPQSIQPGNSPTTDTILVSVLTSEAILSEIAKAQDEAILLRAQRTAAQHFEMMKQKAQDGS